MNTKNEMISETLNKCREFIANCENAMIRNMLVSHGFVVWNPVAETAMKYEFETIGEGKRRAIGSTHCAPYSAPCFTRQDAETLAAETLCGPNQTPARAMFLNDTLALAIECQTRAMEILQRYADQD